MGFERYLADGLVLGALGLLCALLAYALIRFWEAEFDAWRRRRLARRAQQGERRAAQLLLELGYEIEAEQPRQSWLVWVGDTPTEITLRADFLVRLAQERFVAEVKTGRLVADVRHAATRRQLLEYQLAYQVRGVLLVDALAGSVELVRFSIRNSARSPGVFAGCVR